MTDIKMIDHMIASLEALKRGEGHAIELQFEENTFVDQTEQEDSLKSKLEVFGYEKCGSFRIVNKVENHETEDESLSDYMDE